MVITSLCGGSDGSAALTINGKRIYFGAGNLNPGSYTNYHGLREPVLVGENSTVDYGGLTMNGYFINQ